MLFPPQDFPEKLGFVFAFEYSEFKENTPSVQPLFSFENAVFLSQLFFFLFVFLISVAKLFSSLI